MVLFFNASTTAEKGLVQSNPASSVSYLYNEDDKVSIILVYMIAFTCCVLTSGFFILIIIRYVETHSTNVRMQCKWKLLQDYDINITPRHATAHVRDLGTPATGKNSSCDAQYMCDKCKALE